jgi:hypothetical protein
LVKFNANTVIRYLRPNNLEPIIIGCFTARSIQILRDIGCQENMSVGTVVLDLAPDHPEATIYNDAIRSLVQVSMSYLKLTALS